jgi:hypothetical protein
MDLKKKSLSRLSLDRGIATLADGAEPKAVLSDSCPACSDLLYLSNPMIYLTDIRQVFAVR